MDTLTIAVIGMLCISCFLTGAKVGQTVVKDKEIEVPTINPMEVYRKHEARKAAQAEQERVDTIMRNIESYDGTANHQEDVPRG